MRNKPKKPQKPHKIQTKTLERLIHAELHYANGYDMLAQNAYEKMLKHFTDEEFLHEIEHSVIIEKIYIEDIYAHKTIKGVAAELHLDAKTLLVYRKCYVRLFIKYYLDLSHPSSDDYDKMYQALKNKRKRSRKKAKLS